MDIDSKTVAMNGHNGGHDGEMLPPPEAIGEPIGEPEPQELIDQNGRSKRVRKTKIRLEDEDMYLREALGLNKKKRVKRESNGAGEERFQNANAHASSKRFKPKKVDEHKRMSANAIAIRKTERLSDKSLKEHLPVLKYFLTPKVIERLEAADEVEEEVEEKVSENGTEDIVQTNTVAGVEGDHIKDIPDSNVVGIQENGEPVKIEVAAVPEVVVARTDSVLEVPNGDVTQSLTIQKQEVDTSDQVVKMEVEKENGEFGEVIANIEVEQPSSLTNVKMRAYQIEGLKWLVDRYQRGINCILADGENKF